MRDIGWLDLDSGASDIWRTSPTFGIPFAKLDETHIMFDRNEAMRLRPTSFDIVQETVAPIPRFAAAWGRLAYLRCATTRDSCRCARGSDSSSSGWSAASGPTARAKCPTTSRAHASRQGPCRKKTSASERPRAPALHTVTNDSPLCAAVIPSSVAFTVFQLFSALMRASQPCTYG